MWGKNVRFHTPTVNLWFYEVNMLVKLAMPSIIIIIIIKKVQQFVKYF